MKVVELKKANKCTLKHHLEALVDNIIEEYGDLEVSSVSIMAEAPNTQPLWACSNTEDMVSTLGNLELLKQIVLSYLCDD
jgi:hypothetical protein